MQAAPPEGILGIQRDLKIGLDDFDLLFGDRRLVVARTGSSGLAQVLGGVAGMVVFGGGTDITHRYVGLWLEGILGADRKNFALEYASTERALLNGGIPTITIPSLTLYAGGKKWRFGMMSSFWKKDKASIGLAKQLLQATLGPKAEFKKV